MLPYRADWSTNSAGWTGTDDWIAAGGSMLADGTGYQQTTTAPLDLAGIDAYAVEAEIMAIRNTQAGQISGLGSFGVVVRMQDDGDGYRIGRCVSAGIFICAPDQPSSQVAGIWTENGRTNLDVRPFVAGGEWHRYRVEVVGNTITVLIDGQFALSATDNTYREGGRVGLYANRTQVEVRSFEVRAL